MTARRSTAGALLLGLALAGLVGCAEGEPDLAPVPLRLIGRWENASRSHAGRELLIASSWIRFGQGGSVGETHSVQGVRERILGGGVVEYDLACVNAYGQPYTLTLVYDARKGGQSVRFKNQSSVTWTKRTQA
jgi:hypothetical protein